MVSGRTFGAVVFGTSFGVNTHVAALRRAGFEVKALVGRDPAKTKGRAEWAGIPLAPARAPEGTCHNIPTRS